MVAEPGSAPAAPLARVDVEELARDDDDLMLERRPEKGHPLGERGGEAGEVAPDVEGPLRGAVHPDAERLEPLQEAEALRPEGGVDRPELAGDVARVEQRHRRPLQRLPSAAVEEGA